MVSTPDSRRGSSGIALVLIAGLLTLLAFLGLATIGTARFSAAAARAVLSGRSAMCAAESGLEYAAARLWEDPSTPADKGQTPATINRCDDWTERAPTQNPSWGRGDGWQDADGNGAYTTGTDVPFPRPRMDLDGDGHFDAWSGRLRGGDSPFASLFALRVTTPASLACINSGELGLPSGDQDFDGFANQSDADYAADSDLNGIPDWRDPDFYGNVHLVNLLNNLGAVLNLSDTHLEPYAPSPPASPALYAPAFGDVEVSHLGRTVVANRPQEGYRSVTDLTPFIPQADYAAVAPFLAATGHLIRVTSANQSLAGVSAPETRFARTMRLDFHQAPTEILEASLRYLSAGGPFVRLLPVEAARVSAHLDAARKTQPVRASKDLLSTLHAGAAMLWDPDPFIVLHNQTWNQTGIPADPVQPTVKEDLILAQFDPNWYGSDLFHARRHTLEVLRDTTAGFPPDLSLPREFGRQEVTRSWILSAPFTFPPTSQFGLSWGSVSQIPSRQTVPYALTPDRSLFHAEAAAGHKAAVARVSGDLSLSGDDLVLTSQQDFTPLFQSGVAGDPNPPVWRYADGLASCDASTHPVRNGIQCGPRFPLMRPDGAAPNMPVTSFVRTTKTGQTFTTTPNYGEYRYPKGQGWMELSSRQWPETSDGTLMWLNHPDITLAIPHNEDLHGNPPYNNTHWMDNVFDPVTNRFAAPPLTPYLASGYGTALWKSPLQNYVQEGIRLSPWGPRTAPPGGSSTAENFDGDWTQPPFDNSSYVNGISWVREGTIAFWYPAESKTASTFRLLHTAPGTTGWLDYLEITANGPVAGSGSTANVPDTVTLTYNDPALNPASNQASVTFQYPVTQLPALAATGWRCVAIVLKRPGSWVTADVCIDGVPVTQSPLNLYFRNPALTNLPNNPKMRFIFKPAGVDDVAFYRRALSSTEILDLALVPRIAPIGTYTSPRITFDPALHPDGVDLREVVWDAFLPQATEGIYDVAVTGYDAAGNVTGSDSISWDSASGATPRARIDLGARARSFDFSVTITARPLVAMPDGTGAPTPILRDSPTLEEIRFACGPGRPRWSNVQ